MWYYDDGLDYSNPADREIIEKRKQLEREELEDDELDTELEKLLKEKQERRRRKQQDFEM